MAGSDSDREYVLCQTSLGQPRDQPEDLHCQLHNTHIEHK